MRIPFKWLSQWLRADDPPKLDAVIKALEQLGIEIESIDDPTSRNSGLIAVRVDEVSTVDAQSKLQIAKVFDGKRSIRVICKAPNCRKGLLAIFAPIGSTLANGLKIQIRQFGQIESEGMLCGWEEIGLMADIPTLVELPLTFQPGQDPMSWLADPILELGVTPNLGHCLSVKGLAREVARLLKCHCEPPRLPTCIAPSARPHPKFTFDIASDISSVLSWCLISSSSSALPPTPIWLSQRLWQCGMRSINFIVDALNYAMLEMGQPMHAYDLDGIGKNLRFARQSAQHSFQAIDGRDCLAAEGDIVALTESGQIASLAGIIGSATTGVQTTTRSALIESAHFQPNDIQRTSRRLGLLTEASRRMERGVDPKETSSSLERVRSILTLGKISSSDIVATTNHLTPVQPIFCHLKTATGLLGLSMSQSEFEKILKDCSFRPTSTAEGCWCTPPSYRFDLTCEVDIIAEIVRFKGLLSLPRHRSNWSDARLPHDRATLFQTHLRQRCCQLGFAEILSHSLISEKWQHAAGEAILWPSYKEPLTVKKPKSSDHHTLRTGLLASFLQVLLLNYQKGVRQARIFEVARIYCEDTSDDPCEQTALGLLAVGSPHQPHWSQSESPQGFYPIKGHVENFLRGLGIGNLDFLPIDHPRFHPKRAAILQSGSSFVGIFGQLHPRLIGNLGIGAEEVFFCQLSSKALLELSNQNLISRSPSNFPGSQRDWTLTLAEDFSYRQLLDLIPSRDLLISVNLLGIYKSEQLGNDRKNLTLRFCYKSNQKTLSQADVDQEHAGIICELQTRLGAHLLDANLIP